jgi:L-threonylcarbamoyladenylate synthase
MNLLKANSESILNAAKIIKAGGLVAFPTETVYGLGADGLNPIAVAKIFEVKKRPSFNPLILHIDDKSWFAKLTAPIEKNVELLIEKFMPGPLTLVLPKNNIVPDIVTSGNDTVAIRMPNHPVALELIKEAGTPIAAPSANRFGHLSPTEAFHVKKYLGNKVDLILDGGKCSVGIESTIIQYEEGSFYLLRHGGISKEEVEKITGKILNKKPNAEKPNSPGQLPFHYSPNTPLKFYDASLLDESKKIGALFYKKKIDNYNYKMERVLSPSGNLREAAANLFLMLHELESSELDLILVEKIEQSGLGRAIMDRLSKAVNKHY